MPSLSTSLIIKGGKVDEQFNWASNYSQVFDINQELDNNDSFISLLAFNPASKSGASLETANFFCIYNPSDQPAEIRLRHQGITAGATDLAAVSDNGNISYLLRRGEYIVLPNNFGANYTTTDSACNGTDLSKDNAVPDANMYELSGTTVASGLDNTTNPVTFTATDGDYFKLDDLIRVDNEILEVTAISGNSVTVNRGMNGSTPASQADTTAIRLPFFNNYVDFDKHSVAQSDGTGRYKSTNYFGFGRNNGTETSAGFDGWVRGSLAIKFYTGGYQELGMSGLTSSTNSGLTASTTYYFTIAVDGGSTKEISFTPSSNVKFGGSDGVVQKIQDALDAEFYSASSNLFEKKVNVALVGGDLRFTSGQNLSTSTISLTTGTSGTSSTNLIGNAIGRFPADVEDAVSAKLPNDNITKDGISDKNVGSFAFDDGYGNIQGICTGSVDYETGAISLQGCPVNAEMVFSGIGLSGVGCGNSSANITDTISGRSINPKRNTTIRLLGFK